ncbi:MAG: hypothetical protein K0R47_1999, partial [Brevibacillus sp.]|nr:hypothetical protein [Brevibacillus sp.]
MALKSHTTLYEAATALPLPRESLWSGQSNFFAGCRPERRSETC